jgi:1-acyl-sn-glycerol-3-phosphate acyltransferase
VASVGRLSPGMAWLLRRVIGPVVRFLHRPTLEGAELLPPGPYLLVANHSGGMGASELFSFAQLWLTRFGEARPLAGFAHPFGFGIWPLSTVMRSLGTIPATYEHAHEALARGVPLLCFPGGDYEITRPIWQAHRVQFGGRVGYLKIAREARVPVVPMGIRGGHHPVPTLWRSRWLLPWGLLLPKLLGLRWYPLTLLGLAGALAILFAPGLGLRTPGRLVLAWAWLASPFPFIPWVPWRIRIRIGAPISPDELFGPAGDAALDEAGRRVERAVQTLVD